MGIDPRDLGQSNRRQATNLVTSAIKGTMGVVRSVPVEMVMQ